MKTIHGDIMLVEEIATRLNETMHCNTEDDGEDITNIAVVGTHLQNFTVCKIHFHGGIHCIAEESLCKEDLERV